MKKETKLFIEQIESAKTILLTAHKNLDGDALCSMLALSQLIYLNYGKKCVCIYDGNMPEYLHNVPLRENAHFFAQMDLSHKFDLAVLLDYGTVNNLGGGRNAVENAKYIVELDHHKNDNKLGQLCLDDDTAAATACILYNLMLNAGWEYDNNVLNLIALGILTDTGNFKYVKDSRVLRITAELVDAGVDIGALQDLLKNQHRKTIQTEARAVADAEFFHRNRLAIAVIDSGMYKNLDGRGANALSLLGQIKGVEYIALLKEQKPNQIGVSLRGKTMPVDYIAEQLGGGGHMCAAGAVVYDSLENVKQRIIDLFKEA